MARGLKRRRSGFREPRKYKYAIFSEGLVTEPAYFMGMRYEIEKSAAYKDMIYVEGAGCDTLRVLAYAQDWIRNNDVKNCHVWCLYDKDDFPENDFNAVVQKIAALNVRNANDKNGITYHAGWSNECFEYWLVLHCKWYFSQNGRQDYERILNEIFKEQLGKPYSKVGKDCLGRSDRSAQPLYENMLQIGNPKMAIRYAEKQMHNLEEELGENVINKTPSKALPATRVQELVKELARYLEPEAQKHFL